VISFDCTRCGKKLRVKDEFAGQTGQCPSCGEQMEIPNQDTEAAPRKPVYDVLPEGETAPNEERLPQAEPVRPIPHRSRKQDHDVYGWEPAGDVNNHAGGAISGKDDFFVPPPAEIGEVVSATTTLRKGTEPMSPGARLAVAMIAGAVGLFIGVLIAVNLRTPFWQLFWPVVLGGLGLGIALLSTGFSHTCTYVGREGVANFMCEGNRDTLTRQEVFCFRDALELRTAQTRHYYNGAYTGTAYTFTWTDISGVVRFAINGRYKNEKGLPQPTDKFHFAISAESAWTMYLIRQMEAQLQLGSAITFNISRDEWVRVSPGHLRFSFKGQLVDCPVEEIGEARVDQGMFIIKRVDAKEGWFSSQGVFKFPYNQLANAQLFLILLDKFAGVRLG